MASAESVNPMFSSYIGQALEDVLLLTSTSGEMMIEEPILTAVSCQFVAVQS